MSIKFDSITFVRIREAADLLECSQSKVVSETVEQTLSQAEPSAIVTVPEILLKLRVLRELKGKPTPPWD